MGHIQYQRSYRNLSYLYQEGANPGFHEAVGDILSLAVGNYQHLGLIWLDNNKLIIDHLSVIRVKTKQY